MPLSIMAIPVQVSLNTYKYINLTVIWNWPINMVCFLVLGLVKYLRRFRGPDIDLFSLFPLIYWGQINKLFKINY